MTINPLDVLGLHDIASDFRIAGECLTLLITRLEKVLSAADSPQNLEYLSALYRVRDSAMKSYSDMSQIIETLERGKK